MAFRWRSELNEKPRKMTMTAKITGCAAVVAKGWAEAHPA